MGDKGLRIHGRSRVQFHVRLGMVYATHQRLILDGSRQSGLRETRWREPGDDTSAGSHVKPGDKSRVQSRQAVYPGNTISVTVTCSLFECIGAAGGG
jgi:hypothetical protein